MAAPKVSKIRIGRHFTGLVGLDQVLEAMAESHAQAPDDHVAKEMIKHLSRKNYIPDSAHEAYGRALVREFRKFTGRPFEAESPSVGLDIKVLGGGCNICDGLENDLMETLTELGLAANLEHIRDADQIAEYNVDGVPALIINGQVKSVGQLPPKPTLKRWIEETGFQTNNGGSMEKPVFMKNIKISELLTLTELVDYEEGRVVSRTIAQKPAVGLTLFAFDAGESISTHTAPGDAMVQVLDGEALVTIDGNDISVKAGQVVVMPANGPHSVTAVKQFKMLLTVVK